MREVTVEFTMTLPSKEHIKVYEDLAEDGVIGEYFEKLFLQACSAAENKSSGRSDSEDMAIIKEQVSKLTDIIMEMSSRGFSLPSTNQQPVAEAEQPKPPKPKTTPKKRVGTKMNKGSGGFMANIQAKSQSINATRRNG